MDDLTGDTSTATIDYDAAADRIGASLGEELIGKMQDPVETPGFTPEEPTNTPEPAPPVQQAAPAPATTTYEVPKSWKKDMHPHWSKVAPEAQQYIIEREKQLLDGFSSVRPLQEAISPHLDYLRQSNIRPDQAIGSLLTAHRRLTDGPIEQRREAYRQLGRSLQLLDDAQPNGQPSEPTPLDPQIRTVKQEIDTIKQQLEAERQAQIAKIQQENYKTVEAFAADTKAHPYFEDVADDIAMLMRAYPQLSLQEAYDKAVRSNDAVFAKEQQRLLTEAEAKWKENARLAALPKKKAASVNIASNGEGPEPTEPLGSLEDTIKRVHKQIRERA